MQSGQSPFPSGDEPYAALQADEGVAHLTQWCLLPITRNVGGIKGFKRNPDQTYQLTNLNY